MNNKKEKFLVKYLRLIELIQRNGSEANKQELLKLLFKDNNYIVVNDFLSASISVCEQDKSIQFISDMLEILRRVHHSYILCENISISYYCGLFLQSINIHQQYLDHKIKLLKEVK